MRRFIAFLTLFLVGCAAHRPAWHDGISERFVIPEDEDPEHYDFADSFTGQKQFGREVAFEILLKTRGFSTSGVGNGSMELLPPVYAFETLKRQPDACAIFLDLLQRAKPAGKAYALCGLYLVDRRTFNREVEKYRGSSATLTKWAGCVGRTVTLGEIIENTSPDAVRLEKAQSVSEWFNTHPNGGILDIIGGGYPVELMEAHKRDAEAEQFIKEYEAAGG